MAEIMYKGYMECRFKDWENGDYEGTSASAYFTNDGVVYVKKRVESLKAKYPDIYDLIFK